MANLAITLDRRISVNLNYTAPAQSVGSAQEQCEIRTVLTSRKFLEVLPELPLAENVLYLEDLLKDISRQKNSAPFLKPACARHEFCSAAHAFSQTMWRRFCFPVVPPLSPRA